MTVTDAKPVTDLKPLVCYKFKVPLGGYRRLPEPNPHNLEVAGCVAVVLAHTEEEARDLVRETSADNGIEPRWVEVATMTTISMAAPKVLAFAAAS